MEPLRIAVAALWLEAGDPVAACQVLKKTAGVSLNWRTTDCSANVSEPFRTLRLSFYPKLGHSLSE